MITAAQAMEQVQHHARRGEYEAARLWLDIARELREEAMQRRVWGGSAAPAAEAMADMRTLQEVRTDRTEVLRMPAERPGDPIDAEATCVHCGYFIKQGPENAFLVRPWVHIRTGIVHCPVKTPAADETFVYTYAEPEKVL